MIKCEPAFYRNFACIGSACTDNCCIGWEIDVDPETRNRYAAITGDLGEKLKVSLEGEPPHFRRKEDERCVFLNDDNLCELILNGGDGMLCDICRLHPRFVNRLPGREETGTGLCCEVSAAQWLAAELPVRMIETDVPGSKIAKHAAEHTAALTTLRNTLLQAFAGNSPTVLTMRQILSTVRKPDCLRRPKRIDPGPEEILTPEMIFGFDEALCEALHRMESLGSAWDELLDTYPMPATALPALEPRIMAYGIYRYVISSSDVEQLAANAGVAAALMWITARLTESTGDIAFSARMVSKQIEYSQQNLDILRAVCLYDRRIQGI